MNRFAVAGLALLIAGCAGTAQPPATRPPAATIGDEAIIEQRPKPAAYNTAVLPSITRTATVKTAASLLQRPVAAAVVLRALVVGETVQVLGNLDNGDGRWLSVAIGGTQGWIRTDQATEP